LCQSFNFVSHENVRLLEPNVGEKLVAHNKIKREGLKCQNIIWESSVNTSVDVDILSSAEMTKIIFSGSKEQA
jgi:molybdopterin-binding protein